MKKFKLIFLFIISTIVTLAQPFSDDVALFKKQDSILFPAANQILFIGSSSFTIWTDVQNYFPSFHIINRGFGGSSLTDIIRYEKEIIFPYKPKQIVIYCGENDIAGDSTVSGIIVFKRFKTLFNHIRKNLGNIPLAYISMKPSPSRWNMKERMIKGNNLIKKYLIKKNRNSNFIDVWKAMLNDKQQPIENIFLEDKLHMNAKGYAIWQKLIEPILIR